MVDGTVRNGGLEWRPKRKVICPVIFVSVLQVPLFLLEHGLARWRTAISLEMVASVAPRL